MITKKEISTKTISTRRNHGFAAPWKQFVEIGGVKFEKDFDGVTTACDGGPERILLGHALTKKDFIDMVFDYVNNPQRELTNQEYREMYERGDMEYLHHRSISEGMEQMASEMGTNVDNHRFLGDFWYSFDPSEYGFE